MMFLLKPCRQRSVSLHSTTPNAQKEGRGKDLDFFFFQVCTDLYQTCSVIYSLFFGGGEETDHLHRLLQPFKVMTQIFLIFNLKVLLWNKGRQWKSVCVCVWRQLCLNETKGFQKHLNEMSFQKSEEFQPVGEQRDESINMQFTHVQ